ncbi:MAG: hypothetical protein U9Q03_05520 [Patescibacteria group bacterium]|nr:hypothetical protein [Patescibacteria group bacterium]
MDIKRFDKGATHRRVAVTAGVFMLLLAGVTGAGMLVFSPSANAWPVSTFALWNPPGEEGAEAGRAGKTGIEGEDSLLAKLFGFLKDEAPEMDATALAGAALAVASELPGDTDDVGGADDEAGEGAKGAEAGSTYAETSVDREDVEMGEEAEDVVFQVTQQEVDQAMAAGEEAVGFWRSLWNMIVGAAQSVVGTVWSAVSAE